MGLFGISTLSDRDRSSLSKAIINHTMKAVSHKGLYIKTTPGVGNSFKVYVDWTPRRNAVVHALTGTFKFNLSDLNDEKAFCSDVTYYSFNNLLLGCFNKPSLDNDIFHPDKVLVRGRMFTEYDSLEDLSRLN